MFPLKKRPKDPDVFEKVWYIIIENRQEGPFSILDLKKDPRFTPDTLVWKKGFKDWLPARKVSDMADVFIDEKAPSQTIHESFKAKELDSDVGLENQATLTLQQDPYQLFLWIVIALLVIIYAYYQFFEK